MLEVVEEVFSPYLLKLSYIAAEISESIWMLYKIGGYIPVRLLKFDDNEKQIQLLSKLGLIRWITAGKGKDFSTESMSLSLNDDSRELIGEGLSKIQFKERLFEIAGKEMMRYSKTLLTKTASRMLANIIKSSTPQKPVLANKIVRAISNSSFQSFNYSASVLEFYLDRYLGLLKTSGSQISLTEKAMKILEKNDYLLKVYNTEYKMEPLERITRPEFKIQEDKVNRELKSYFPWMRF